MTNYWLINTICLIAPSTTGQNVYLTSVLNSPVSKYCMDRKNVVRYEDTVWIERMWCDMRILF